MSLEFRPPPESLVSDYINRKQPAEIASEGIGNALQTYMQMKAQKNAQDMAQEDRDIKLAGLSSEGGTNALDTLNAIRRGRGMPPITLPASQPTAPPAPVPQADPSGSMGLVAASIAAGHGNPLGLQMPGGPQTPAGKPTAPDLGSDPAIEEFNQIGSRAYLQKYGKTGMEKVKTALEIQKGQQEKPTKVPVMTREQALAAGTVDPNAKIVEPVDTSGQDQRYNSNQDRLEGQAINRLSQLRGDQSLARVENQRDAAIQAYNTIDQIKREGRDPSKIEYYDILGQMWKARTGASPTDQSLKDLDSKTFHGDLGKAYTYFSGKPGGATTPEVLQNIQNFAAQSGAQADKFHDAYYAAHKIKPSGLEDARWQPILNAHRGLSFSEATGYSGQASGPKVGDVEGGYRFKGGNPSDKNNWEKAR